jgi:hypothetical protein
MLSTLGRRRQRVSGIPNQRAGNGPHEAPAHWWAALASSTGPLGGHGAQGAAALVRGHPLTGKALTAASGRGLHHDLEDVLWAL